MEEVEEGKAVAQVQARAQARVHLVLVVALPAAAEIQEMLGK